MAEKEESPILAGVSQISGRAQNFSGHAKPALLPPGYVAGPFLGMALNNIRK